VAEKRGCFLYGSTPFFDSYFFKISFEQKNGSAGKSDFIFGHSEGLLAFFSALLFASVFSSPMAFHKIAVFLTPLGVPPWLIAV